MCFFPGGIGASDLQLVSQSISMLTVRVYPTAASCISKLNTVVPTTPNDDLLAEIQGILDAVIADFESMPGPNGEGGTGRRFLPVTETRTYDGSGQAILRVDDIVPNTTITVSAYGVTLTDVILSDNHYQQGHNTLVRPNYPYTVVYPVWGVRRIFPSGIQNVAVQATFGFDSQVPADVFESLRCETVYRLLVQGYVPLSGIGERLKLGDYENDTAAGISVWKESSPIAIFHKTYEDCKAKYRDNRPSIPGRMVRKMY